MFSSSNDSPASANRYILPYERQFVVVHSHPAILIGPIFMTLVGLAVAGWASNTLKSGPDVILSIWIAWSCLLLYLISRVTRWINDLFMVTSERIVLIRGLLARDVASMPLTRAAGMRLRRTTMGRVLGYGHLIFDGSRQEQGIRAVYFVPYPEQLYLEIYGLIYPADDRRGDQQPDPP